MAGDGGLTNESPLVGHEGTRLRCSLSKKGPCPIHYALEVLTSTQYDSGPLNGKEQRLAEASHRHTTLDSSPEAGHLGWQSPKGVMASPPPPPGNRSKVKC